MYILQNPSPTALDNAKWSNEFNDFLACCLEKDPALRQTADELLEHPWFDNADGLKEEFCAKFQQMVEENEND